MKLITADIENNPRTLEVWAVGMCVGDTKNESPDYFKHFKGWDEFFEELWKEHNKSVVYFRNLAYDGTFALYWLMKQGFLDYNELIYRLNKDLVKYEIYYEEEETFSEMLERLMARGGGLTGTFKPLISVDVGVSWYQLGIYGKDKLEYEQLLELGRRHAKNREKRKQYEGALASLVTKDCITFKDSLKKIPFSIKATAEMMKLPIMKGDIDYELDRGSNWEMSEEEKAYLKNDCEIDWLSLSHFMRQGLTGLTIGGDCLADFYRVTGEGLLDRLGENKEKYSKGKIKRLGEKYFRQFHPMSIEEDRKFRKYYKGGLTMVSPKNGDYTGAVKVFDVNSMYPSIMAYSQLPEGEGVEVKEKVSNIEKYSIYGIKCKDIRLKKNSIPCLHRRSFGVQFSMVDYEPKSSDYVYYVKGEHEVYVSQEDFELLDKNYDFEIIDVIEHYEWKVSDRWFKDYILKWYGIKNECKGKDPVTYLISKLMLNNLYGKFGTNPVKDKVFVYYESDGKIRVGNRDITGVDEIEPLYIPLAIAITSKARKKLLDFIDGHYEDWVYSDTDSVHFKASVDEKALVGIGRELGEWDYESYWEGCKYVKSKTYLHIGEKGNEVKCAGMKKELQKMLEERKFKIEEGRVIFDEKLEYKGDLRDAFGYGLVYEGNLKSKSVVGGKQLYKADFKIMHKSDYEQFLKREKKNLFEI